MTNDKRTLMSAIEDLQRQHKDDPNCFTSHDLKDLDTLTRSTHWLSSESYRGQMNSARHHQVFDTVHSLLRKLEKKCNDYHYQKKRRAELLYQEKFNSNHKPAGSPDGGQFDFGPGGGSSGGSGTEAPHIPSGNDRPGKPDTRPIPSSTQPAHADKLPKTPKPMKVYSAVQRIKDRAKPRPDDKPRCAQYVREAINNGGGLDVQPPPKRPGKGLPEARDYGKPLTDAGFKPAIKPTTPGEDFPPKGEHYNPEKGDVAVIQATSKNESGHMAMYTGSGVGEGWISDFKQHGFWPGSTYAKEKPSYTIYSPPK